MLIGYQISLTRAAGWQTAVNEFAALAKEFDLKSAELHLDTALYENAVWPLDTGAAAIIQDRLRPCVDVLGVHLPFYELNPFSKNRLIRKTSITHFEDSIRFAGLIGADYVVFHARCDCFASTAVSVKDWIGLIKKLAEQSAASGMHFCIENADTIPDLATIETIINSAPGTIHLCMDIGHLFERDYERLGLKKYFYLINDRFSPWPFMFKAGLPLHPYKSIFSILKRFKPWIQCVHVHNHDGRTAHQPLSKGKINFAGLKAASRFLSDVPVIIESDYTSLPVDNIKTDLQRLNEIAQWGK